MLCLRFSLLLLLMSSSVFAGRFSSKECLDSRFTTEINHKGKFFGLVPNRLSIVKEDCKLSISFKNILETKWKIDICREPIHVKVHSKGGESFYKRKGTCDESDKSEFCNYWGDLKENLQDYGLIYADGERETLSSPHGQTYCTYLLLQKYLDAGVLFSKYEKVPELFKNKAQESEPTSLLQKAPESTWSGADKPEASTFTPQSSDLEEMPDSEPEDDKPRF